jgi:hypothetical protein
MAENAAFPNTLATTMTEGIRVTRQALQGAFDSLPPQALSALVLSGPFLGMNGLKDMSSPMRARKDLVGKNF